MYSTIVYEPTYIYRGTVLTASSKSCNSFPDKIGNVAGAQAATMAPRPKRIKKDGKGKRGRKGKANPKKMVKTSDINIIF